jgi:type III restriction enzyme
MPEREALEITFPRVLGYRYDLPTDRLTAEFTPAAVKVLATDEIATWTELDPIAGATTIADLSELKSHRLQEVAFVVAKRTLDNYFRDPDGNEQPWLFPQVLRVAQRWMTECLVCHGNAFPQMLLLAQESHDAADRIYHAIVRGTEGEKRLLPILRPYDPIGSTRYVDFTTTKPVYATERSHLNYLVLDSGWEAKLGQVLDNMDEVAAYVKNQGLNFKIPYTFEGQSRNYQPDLLVRIEPAVSPDTSLVIEVTGEQKKEKAAKVDAARTLWIPAINNHGRFGRWLFLEVTDPWDAESLIRASLQGEP